MSVVVTMVFPLACEPMLNVACVKDSSSFYVICMILTQLFSTSLLIIRFDFFFWSVASLLSCCLLYCKWQKLTAGTMMKIMLTVIITLCSDKRALIIATILNTLYNKSGVPFLFVEKFATIFLRSK